MWYVWLLPPLGLMLFSAILLRYGSKQVHDGWLGTGIICLVAALFYMLVVSVSSPNEVFTPISNDTYKYTKFENRVFVVFESGKISYFSDSCTYNRIDEGLVVRRQENVWGCSMYDKVCVERCCGYGDVQN